MATIAYILLCHKDPEGIIAQAERLTAAGDCIAIHFDARARREDYDRIRSALADNPAVVSSDPQGEGWIVKFRLSNPAQLESLMDAAAYEAEIAQA